MNIKLALLDFDGTLVTKDILDLLCESVGKGQESKALNLAFHQGKIDGLTPLIERINFLKGFSKTAIQTILKKDSFLMPGANDLMEFFHKNGITTILASGNIIPVLEHYQDLLGIDYLVGTQPAMKNDTITGIDRSAFSSTSFKLDGIIRIIAKHGFKKENIIAIGDSPADKEMFSLANYSIAINPKGDIGTFANKIIENTLFDAKKYLTEILK